MGVHTRVRTAIGLLASILFMLALSPAVAAATTYYAKAFASGSCTQNDPCNLVTAVNNATVDGVDAVVLEPGATFVPGVTIDILHNIDIGGQAGAAMPTVQGPNGNNVINLQGIGGAGPTLHDVHLVQSGGNDALRQVGGTAERLLVTTTGIETACDAAEGLLRDSVCWSEAGNGIISVPPAGGTFTPEVRNVTAIGGASGSGIALIGGPGEVDLFNGVNVIARGGLSDVRTDLGGGVGPMTATLSHSSYATVDTSLGGAITPPGSNGNEIAPPLFANPATGDFHQLTSSPTVDAGATDSLIGSEDLDLKPRSQPLCVGNPGIPDIGAYELQPPAPACSKFTFGKLKRNKRKGTATLKVTVPGAGRLSLRGHKVVKQRVAGISSSTPRKTVSSAGTVKLTIRAKGKTRRKLNRRGHAKVKVTVTFTPTGGASGKQSKRVKLIKRLG